MEHDIIGRLSCGVMAGEGDLEAMGECLNLLDALEARDGAEGPKGRALREVRGALSRLILESSGEREEDWALVRRGIDALTGEGPALPSEAAPASECPPPPPPPPPRAATGSRTPSSYGTSSRRPGRTSRPSSSA